VTPAATQPAVSGRHILIIKLGALGDVVLALPLIEQLLRHHEGEQVTLLTAPSWRQLVTSFPGLEIVTFERRGAGSMLRLFNWLLRQQFDAVYDLQGSLRSRIMTLLTQADMRAGPQAALAYTHAPIPGRDVMHAFDRFNSVLTAAGVAVAEPGLRLPSDAATGSRVTHWLQRHGLAGKPLVLVHAGGSPAWPSKRWPEQSFSELAQALAGQGLAVVWLGSAAERDLNRRLARTVGVDATAAFSLAELAVLGGHARFVLSNDSGPMHVLALAGVPVYALFGPTDWRRSHALGQQDNVLYNPVECSPCHLPVCPPQRAHACLAGLAPEVVLARIEADGLLAP
jgi:ADP-heptose:LPS heptosyltransferase